MPRNSSSNRTSKTSRRERQGHFQRRTKPGAPPGSIEVDPQAPHPLVRLTAFGPDEFEEHALDDLDTLRQIADRAAVVWVHVEGLGDAATIRRLGEAFDLHPLALEDVVNAHQRPKVDEYGKQLFIVARLASFRAHLSTEQVSMFLGRNFVVTFLERSNETFDAVRERLRTGGPLRAAGSGYLAYALLDSLVDSYFPLIEAYAERLDNLEDAVTERPDRRAISNIHDAKRDLRTLRRAIWPLREALNTLCRDSSPLMDGETQVHLRDCYDHTVQIIDLVETYRELGSDLTDLYLSGLSNRMNEIMKVLTVIATIFMPVSFIASIYGMNFDRKSPWNMPELGWRFGYLVALGLMAASVAGMMFFFYRRGWLQAVDGGAAGRDADQAQPRL